MGMSGFIASQLRKPSGLFGRVVISNRLKRSNVAINQATLTVLALEPDDRVLEVGFGPGDLISRMAPLVPAGSVSGVDFSQDMVALCAKRFAASTRSGRIELRCASAEALPYGDGRFTKACSVNTVYFWSDPAVPLSEFRRVLVDGGRLVLSFSPRATMQSLGVAQHGFALYDPDQIRVLLGDAGFGGIEMVPGDGPRGEFVCAIAVKQ
ncbi:MAG: methyltransferase domain-containing protein [Coriobacteriia bacterium]